MTLTINDIWQQFNREIFSQDDSDYTKKAIAINSANRHLLTRWLKKTDQNSGPKEFMVRKNLSNSAYSNQIALPDDFLCIDNVWYKQGGNARDTLTYTAVSGTFIAGDIITGGTSGSIATITDTDTGELEIAMNADSDYFLANETITDATLTKTGTVDATLKNNYIPMQKNQFKTWDSFVRAASMQMFDPTATGNYFGYFTINDQTLYIDRYITDASSNIAKISYWKLPDTLYLLDKMVVVVTAGSLTGGYSVSGGTNLYTANIDSISGSTIYIDTSTKTGDFIDGEVISVVDSSGTNLATATITTYTPLYQNLEWRDRHRDIFIEACVFCYFKLRGLDEAVQHDVILENMIDMMAGINKNDTVKRWGFSD